MAIQVYPYEFSKEDFFGTRARHFSSTPSPKTVPAIPPAGPSHLHSRPVPGSASPGRGSPFECDLCYGAGEYEEDFGDGTSRTVPCTCLAGKIKEANDNAMYDASRERD